MSIEMLRRGVMVLAGIAVATGTSVAVMIHGWGLEPKSWGWVIGAYVLGQLGGQAIIWLSRAPARSE